MKTSEKLCKKICRISFVFLVCIMATYINVEAGCRGSGGRQYCANNGGAVTRIEPVYESQARHNSNLTTSIGVSKTVTDSIGTTGSLSYGLSAWGISVASSIGVSESVSQSTTTSVDYILGALNQSGLYRIEIVFPGKKVNFSTHTNEGMLVSSRSVSYAPNTDASYRRLSRYGN